MTQPPPASIAAEGSSVSRELADFLVDLAVAMQKTAIYPPGHPLLENAVEGVVRRLGALLEDRPNLSIGVARRQLVIEGVATNPNHPLLRELARRFHRHHLGALRFSAGVSPSEVADVLITVSSSPDGPQGGTPLGLGPPEGLTRWQHVRLFALTYEQLQLLEGEEGEEGTAGGTGNSGGRAAQLWIGLARAAMMAESTAVADDRVNDPVAVARAIDEHHSDEAYDQVIVGYLLQIAAELKAAGGIESPALQARVSRMVGSLDPSTLRRLLEMGGNGAQRKRFVSDAASGMKLDAVIDLVSAAAESSNQTISHSLLRLFRKLATHAERDAGPLSDKAESALRENVHRLLDGWKLDDPNPDQYTAALEGMASAMPEDDGSDAGGELEADRVVQMSLETGAVGDLVWEAVALLCAKGRIAELLEMTRRAPPTPATDAIVERTATQENLRAVLAQPTPDPTVVEGLTRPLALAAAEPLLDALDNDALDERATRALSDLIVSIGADAGELVASRIPVSSWRVQRALVAILGRLPELPGGFVPSELAGHPDGHVRVEALKLMLARDAHRERALRAALADSDLSTLRLGLVSAVESCPPRVVPVILRRMADPDLATEFRVLAIRVLAASHARAAMDYLMNLSVRKRRFWGHRIPPKSPEVLAALGGLAQHWAGDPKAKTVIALAARDGDPEIRAAVTVEKRR